MTPDTAPRKRRRAARWRASVITVVVGMCLASGIAVVRAAPPRWPAAAPPAPTASFVLAAAENPERACAWVVGPARQHCPHRTRPRTTAPRGHGAGGWLLLPPAAAALALLILRRAGRR